MLTEEYKREIQTCLQMNECQFDLQTVQAFCAAMASPKHLTHFSSFLKQDRARVESHYAARFDSFIDVALYRALEDSLDPGFEKLCGIKGSKLSGG